MSLLESVGTSFANSFLDAGSKALSSSVNYYFGGKSEKRSNERNQRLSARDRLENFKYSLADKTYDYYLNKQAYDYSNAEQYRLAQEYAQNSASWQVNGLRRAGLNPILAATNGNFGSTFGSTGSMSAGGGTFSGSHTNSGSSNWHSSGARIDLAETLRDISSAKQMETDTDIKDKTKPSVIATNINTALKSGAEVDKIKADTALTLAEARKTESLARQLDSSTALNNVRSENESRVKGVNGLYSGISYLLHGPLMDMFKQDVPALNDMFNKLKHLFNTWSSDSSAKSSVLEGTHDAIFSPSGKLRLDMPNVESRLPSFIEGKKTIPFFPGRDRRPTYR